MGITTSNTQWVFILAASKKPEDRHLQDISFGVSVLLQKKVSIEHIILIIDDDEHEVKKKFGSLLPDDFKIYHSNDIQSVLTALSHTNAFICVTGHGGINGLAAASSIKPYTIINALKKNSTLKKAFLFLGQCYAGIFNYTDVVLRTKKSCYKIPKIVIIGATNIAESLSVPYTYRNQKWYANIMFVALFQWLFRPVDIDGDNTYSIIDLFKYITAITNKICYELEEKHHLEAMQLITLYSKRLGELDAKRSLSAQEKLEQESIKKRLGHNHIHQEAWILNALPAIQTSIRL